MGEEGGGEGCGEGVGQFGRASFFLNINQPFNQQVKKIKM